MYTGLTGALAIVDLIAAPVAYISGWSISDNTEIIEATKIDSINKNSFPGMQSWSASADGAISFECDSGQEELFEAKYSGKKVHIRFFLDVEGGAEKKGIYFDGEAYIESLSVDLSAEDKGNISISIIGDGPLDLYINGKPVRDGALDENNTFRMFVREDGYLCAYVPEGKEDIISMKDGYLVLKL